MSIITLKHENSGAEVSIVWGQLQQACRICQAELQNRWIYTTLGKRWACLNHLSTELLFTPSEASSDAPIPRTKHAILHGSVHTNPMNSLHDACAAAEAEGMVMLALIPTPDGSLVASFVGAESVIGGTE